VASGVFYGKDRKNVKYNLLVIRIKEKGKLANARPCHNCVDMMKCCGIKNIFYSTEDGIICEKVNTIVSINSSSVSRLIERTHYKAPKDDTEYYTKLLLSKFPKNIKEKSLCNFLNYNIKNVLPFFKWKIKNNKIIFYDKFNNHVLTSFIY
jgi:hypothetical protein